jgi:hypothetical protein
MHTRRFLLLFILLSAFATLAHADGAGLDPHGIRGCASGGIGCVIDPNGSSSDAGARIDDNG